MMHKKVTRQQRTVVLGYMKVRGASLLLPNDRFVLVFLKDALVAARIHGEFDKPTSLNEAAETSGIAAGGIIGLLIAKGLSKTSVAKNREKKAKAKIAAKTRLIGSTPSVQHLLDLDKKNFQVRYADIASVVLNESKIKSRLGTLEIKGKRRAKFVIPLSEDLSAAKKLLQRVFGRKLQYRESFM